MKNTAAGVYNTLKITSYSDSAATLKIVESAASTLTIVTKPYVAIDAP